MCYEQDFVKRNKKKTYIKLDKDEKVMESITNKFP